MLLKLVLALPTHQCGKGQSFRGWLFRATVNQGRDFRRRKATRALPGPDGLSAVSDDSVSELEESEYRRLLVRRGLEVIRVDFSEITWTAFTRVMVEGELSPADVAAEMNLSVNAVFLARHRVLTRLRQELDGLLE